MKTSMSVTFLGILVFLALIGKLFVSYCEHATLASRVKIQFIKIVFKIYIRSILTSKRILNSDHVTSCEINRN